MKAIEQAAIEQAAIEFSLQVSKGKHLRDLIIGFREGANWANSWNKFPDKEPPFSDEPLLVLFKDGRGKIKPGIARYGYNPYVDMMGRSKCLNFTIQGSVKREVIMWKSLDVENIIVE